MANQYKNKIIYGNQTLMDITDTTATENDVLEGEVFYSASGARSVGTLGDATQSAHGLMSATDKTKLDGIDLSLKANKTDTILISSLTMGTRQEGYATGTNSVALGTNNRATATSSFVNGENSLSTGPAAISMGYYCEATNYGSNALGVSAKAYGFAAHADGNDTQAYGDYSSVSGRGTLLYGRASHIFGEYNIDSNGSSTAAGDRGAYVEIVGNGTSGSARSNARMLTWAGTEYLGGDLYVNCDSDGTNGSKVATETYVTTAISGKANSASLATVATTGSYTDLLDKPDLSQYLTSVPTMTGATSSANGTAGLIPAPTSADAEKFFRGDGTWQDGGRPMVILSYGNSTWNDFITAYKNNVIVYCRASSNSNPATGSQTRMAFMAYVSDATNPTNVEFQYYRSMSSHSATAMGDEVYVYKLTNAGAWSVTVRKASIKEIAVASGSKLGVSWSSDKVTLSNTMTADDMPMSNSDATTTKATIDTLSSNLIRYTGFPPANSVEYEYGDYGNVKYYVKRIPFTVSTLATADTTLGNLGMSKSKILDYSFVITNDSVLNKDYYAGENDWFRLWILHNYGNAQVHIKQGTQFPVAPYTVYLTIYYIK